MTQFRAGPALIAAEWSLPWAEPNGLEKPGRSLVISTEAKRNGEIAASVERTREFCHAEWSRAEPKHLPLRVRVIIGERFLSFAKAQIGQDFLLSRCTHCDKLLFSQHTEINLPQEEAMPRFFCKFLGYPEAGLLDDSQSCMMQEDPGHCARFKKSITIVIPTIGNPKGCPHAATTCSQNQPKRPFNIHFISMP